MTRRDYLQLMAAGAAAANTVTTAAYAAGDASDRERRMKWWHEARFGMFIHWGLYSVLGRHEWVMEDEGIPVAEYEQLAKRFKPKPNAAREWARLAKQAGQKYMVMTTKHHEGFCNFDTKLTNYCAPKQGPGRDLVKEYVEAARAEGLRVGFYYSLMDWHHPDGARCATDEQARRRFVDYIHGQIRELHVPTTAKIDILWYDVAWPLDAEGWESEKMNEMVFKLQPDIIVNNRNKLEGDFATPEQTHTGGEQPGLGILHDDERQLGLPEGRRRLEDSPRPSFATWSPARRDTGNYLLNIGPKPDGSVPEESVRILTTVGKWMDRNGQSIYRTEKCQPRRSNYAGFTRNGNTLYMHIHFWPGEVATIGGMMTKVKSARLLATGKEVKVEQDKFRVRFMGLPAAAPDDPVTTIAIECEEEPRQDTDFVRKERPRLNA